MREQQKKLNAESPVIKNPAKRMAGQFMDRFPLIFGSGIMAAVEGSSVAKCQSVGAV